MTVSEPARLAAMVASALDPAEYARTLTPPPDLVVVGTGIRAAGQLTVEAIAHISSADAVYYLVTEPVARAVVRHLQPSAIALDDLYETGKPRRETYEAMAARILDSVRSGRRTCAVFYGHPGVFVDPAHAAVRQARAGGYRAVLTAGISAEDCLFADLDLDPAVSGCQSYEAMDFLVNRRRVDATSHLVIWQIGVLGDRTFSLEVRDSSPLGVLVDRLAETHPRDHVVTIYDAAVAAGAAPRITRVPLASLDRSLVSIVSTLHVPPAEPPRVDFEMYFRLTGG